MNVRNKILTAILVASVGYCGYQVVVTNSLQRPLYAELVDTGDSAFTGLTASYYKIEGNVGDIITDFVVDYKGMTLDDYVLDCPTHSFIKTKEGLELIEPGEGTATIKFNNSTYKFDYVVNPDPNAPAEETKEGSSTNQEGSSTNPEGVNETIVDYKTCTLTANGTPCVGLITYIDDSKNAFKNKGSFYIQKEFLDGKTHSLYIAKFTSEGPVAYKITDFTSLAGEINFMGYNPEEIEINDLAINIKNDLAKLF